MTRSTSLFSVLVVSLALAGCAERKPGPPPTHPVAPVGKASSTEAPVVACEPGGAACPDGKTCKTDDGTAVGSGTCR